MFKNPFSYDGRIRRTEYGLSFIIFIVARVIGVFISAESSSDGVFFIFLIPTLWFLYAQGAKRCHDLGKNGWWQLIPFYGFWMIFQDGEPGTNEYGDNPKGIQVIGGQKYQAGKGSSAADDFNGGYGGGYNGGHNSVDNSGFTGYPPTGDSKSSDGYKEGDLYK